MLELSADVRIFRFDPFPFSYKSGQFITFVFRNGKEEIRRSFSLISSPDEFPAICVKRIPNGVFTRFLFEKVDIGTQLQCVGSNGFFVLPENEEDQNRPIIFFAAGTGIAPVRALIRTALHSGKFGPVYLLFSIRNRNEAYFREELEKLSHEYHGKLMIRYLESGSSRPEEGRLQPLLLEKLLAQLPVDLSRALFYLCGPFPYMRMITFVLRTNNIKADQIRSEQFFNDRPNAPAMPPETGKHVVSVHAKNSSIRLEVQYPDTILKAAIRAGANIPFSCEYGRCGSCAAKCVSGKVWMFANEVLTDKDLNEGYVLTCTAYPLTDVSLIV